MSVCIFSNIYISGNIKFYALIEVVSVTSEYPQDGGLMS